MKKVMMKRVVASRAPRRLDKQILSFHDAPGAGQAAYQIYPTGAGTTYPGTVTGLRWNIDFTPIAGISLPINWAIVIVKQGQVTPPINNPAVTPGVLVEPEQNCLAAGTCYLNATTLHGLNEIFNDKTKSMRKLQPGDKLMLLMACAGTYNFTAIIQFFFKS